MELVHNEEQSAVSSLDSERSWPAQFSSKAGEDQMAYACEGCYQAQTNSNSVVIGNTVHMSVYWLSSSVWQEVSKTAERSQGILQLFVPQQCEGCQTPHLFPTESP